MVRNGFRRLRTQLIVRPDSDGVDIDRMGVSYTAPAASDRLKCELSRQVFDPVGAEYDYYRCVPASYITAIAYNTLPGYRLPPSPGVLRACVRAYVRAYVS